VNGGSPLRASTNYDARLDDWFVIIVASEGVEYITLLGTVWFDRKNRFRDGRMIQTSPLKDGRSKLGMGKVVSTANSLYLLGKPLSGARPQQVH
jgi:hypothetical protein